MSPHSDWVTAWAITHPKPSTEPLPPIPEPPLEARVTDLEVRVARLEADLIDPFGDIGGF